MPLSPPGTRPDDTRPRCGSPPSGCSILSTSAPHSARTAPAAGTNVHDASSTTRIPSIGFMRAHCHSHYGPFVRWRRLARVVFVVLLLGACSSDTKPSSAASSSSSPAPRVLQILVSNDDGVTSEGIDALVQALVAEPA